MELQLPPIKEQVRKKKRKKVIKQTEHDQLIQVCSENIPKDLLGLIEQTRRLEVEMVEMRERCKIVNEQIEEEV